MSPTAGVDLYAPCGGWLGRYDSHRDAAEAVWAHWLERGGDAARTGYLLLDAATGRTLPRWTWQFN